jgi:cbb3-type cytochrome oxidase maturation protein
MSILFVLIPLGLVLLAVACVAFAWAARNGQFEELDRAAASILLEESKTQDAPRSEDD